LYGLICEDAKIATFYISYKDCDGVECSTKPNKFAHIDDFEKWCNDNGVTKYDTFTDIRLVVG